MKRKMDQSSAALTAKSELKKHVAVIHSSNKLTLLQRKIANALLFNAYADLLVKEEHTIHIGKLCEIIGYDSHDHKSIKRALVNLLSTVLEWNLVDGEKLDIDGVWNASSIIADASIDGAFCTYSYSNKMKNLLYRPNVYGRLDMNIQSQFKSSYGLALYENCNRFQDIGQTPWFSLNKFRKLMGVGEKKYKIFRDFKTRVLDKALDEVNKYSAFMLEPQFRKEKRQIISIQFMIQKRKGSFTQESEKKPSKEHDVSGVLELQFGFSMRQVQNTLHRYEAEYIQQKISLVQTAASFKSGKIKNLTRYLLSALRNDYQKTLERSLSAPVNKATITHHATTSLNNDILYTTAFRRFQDKQLMQLYNGLTQRSQVSILKKFEKFLQGMYLEIYFKTGLENILLQEQLCIFLREIKHKIMNRLITYEVWKKQNTETMEKNAVHSTIEFSEEEFIKWRKSLSNEHIRSIVPLDILNTKIRAAITCSLRSYYAEHMANHKSDKRHAGT